MEDSISVTLDLNARHALRRIEATGVSRDEAVRHALIAASARLRSPDTLAAEVAGLEADPVDRAEMRELAAFMASLR